MTVFITIPRIAEATISQTVEIEVKRATKNMPIKINKA